MEISKVLRCWEWSLSFWTYAYLSIYNLDSCN